MVNMKTDGGGRIPVEKVSGLNASSPLPSPLIAYHVCGLSKFRRYVSSGKILPPVRAWEDIKDAERFSKQTGRPIIIRLKLLNPKRLFGHKCKAVVTDLPYDFKKYIGGASR